MSTNARLLIFLVFLAAAASLIYTLPVGTAIAAFLDWVTAHRAIAWLVYIVVYAAGTVLLVPGSIITIAAGFVFGLAVGTAIVSAGSTLGALLAFLLGRRLVRDWVAGKIAGQPRFEALDRATRGRGFSIVLLTRLSPIFPFNLLNYALGLTQVQVRDYLLASWIGMLPGTILYVYIGTLANDVAYILAGDVDAGPAGTILLGAGLIATVLLIAMLTRHATRLLNERLDATTGETTAAPSPEPKHD